VFPSIFCHILLLHFVFTDVQLRDVHLSQAEKEPILSSFLYASVLSHDCLEQALGFVLANRLEDPTLLATQLIDIFNDVMMNNKDICRSIRFDAQVSNCYLCNSPIPFHYLLLTTIRTAFPNQAFKDKDPACAQYSWALLYLKVCWMFI
jgi:serine O-acetyltransferase